MTNAVIMIIVVDTRIKIEISLYTPFSSNCIFCVYNMNNMNNMNKMEINVKYNLNVL